MALIPSVGKPFQADSLTIVWLESLTYKAFERQNVTIYRLQVAVLTDETA